MIGVRGLVRAASHVGFVTVVLGILAAPGPGYAQPPGSSDGGWIGTRVLTRYGAVIVDPRSGKTDDEGRSKSLAVAGKDRSVFRVYRVEHVSGPWLWLHQENGSVEGWVDAQWVLPLDQAVGFYTDLIRSHPSAAVYNTRANVWKAKGEFAIAIADYNEAVRLDPRDETIYNNRGRARHARGEYERAIADYTEAIRLDPKYPFAYLNRGIARAARKEYDTAVADLDEAIRLDSAYPRPYYSRAAISLLTGRDAEADARATIERTGWRGDLATYAALIGHFAARRAGHDDAARHWLDDAAREANRDAWPYPIVRFLRKEIDEPSLLAQAGGDVHRQAEARGFLGLDHLLAGRTEAARGQFRWVKEKGDPRNTVSTIAAAELDRLDTKAGP